MKFRKLKAHEIDVRTQSVTKTGSGAILLLYKDARCDMNILDETVGALNWKREHSRDNANCTVSLYNENINEWISKEDTGTESNTQAEKGLASDSFKRACFNWGIGRELYTAPFIWIPKDKVKDLKIARYSCEEIDYDENGVISHLVISSDNKVVYTFGKKGKQKTNTKKEKVSKQDITKATEYILEQMDKLTYDESVGNGDKGIAVTYLELTNTEFMNMLKNDTIKLAELIKEKTAGNRKNKDKVMQQKEVATKKEKVEL